MNLQNLKWKKWIFLWLFILCTILIFFVAWKFDKETNQRNLWLTSHGVQEFRKGLDVSGGTKLIFKISYDKYEEIYSKNPAQLASIKKTVEEIIKKNIDKRISKLWVSDYKAYSQNLDDKQYLIVEIGGIADLDQAKEIIGKTVELEFRLPNEEEPSTEQLQKRKEIAIALRDQSKENLENMKNFAENRWSENIFYNKFENVTLSQLPNIYKTNSKLLNSITTGEISDLFEWAYDSQMSLVWESIETNTFKWFSFFHLIDKQTIVIEKPESEDIINTAKELWYKYEQSTLKTETTLSTGEYTIEENSLNYVTKEIAKDEKAFNIKIYELSTGANIENEKNNLINDQEVENGQLINGGRLSESEVRQSIISFDSESTDKIQSYNQLWKTYLIKINDKKESSEKMYETLLVKDINESIFENAIKTRITYTLEDVFVNEKETWKTAKTNNNEILNGAYFQMATSELSQTWEPTVSIQFNDKWKQIFCDITTENVKKQMAIFVGWEIKTAPTIQSEICGGTAQINGSFTTEEAKNLADELNEWALPAPLILMQEEKISPSLWSNALNNALLAALVGILAVIVYMFVTYGLKKALITLGILTMFVGVLWAFMKLSDYALSLSGIAAVILSIGMAVDANILIFERMKEEKEEWKSNLWAIENAYDRSRNAIRDGNISTAIIAILLYAFGSNIFKWFWSMLLITSLITLFINVPLTKELLKVAFRK